MIIRHADAENKQNWPGPDGLRPLSTRGAQQAATLTRLAGQIPVRRLLASPASRCLQTVSPLADLLGIAVEPTPHLAIGVSADALLDLLDTIEANGTVLCTHQEVINTLFGAWHDGGWHRLSQPGSRTGKGEGWLIQQYPSASATATYLPIQTTSPPSLDTDTPPPE